MFFLYVVGTAGSGKSLFTSAFKQWMIEKGWNVVALNLDPGAEFLPYRAEVDIRTMIDIHEIMDRYELGPNGALIFAADLISTKLKDVQAELDEEGADYVIVDTPGQLELFAYRKSGPYIVQGLRGEGKAMAFLSDPWMLNSPENFLSVMLLASSIRIRFKIPFIQLLTKIDIAKEEAKKVMKWNTNPRLLENELMGIKEGESYLMYTGLFRYLFKRGMIYKLIPTSSVTMYGFPDVSAALANLFRGGEEVAE
jgi:hypothetical protein